MSNVIDIDYIGHDMASDISKDVNRSINDIGDGADKSMGKLSKVTDIATTALLGLGAAAATAIVAFGVESFNTAVKIEDSMADVRKSVGLTEEQTFALKQQILELAPATRTSVDELIGITKVAGQIGIAEEDIMGFVTAVDKITVALGDEFSGGAEEVTGALGTLKTLYGELKDLSPEDAMLKVGSAMNALGAAGSATGPEMAEFTNRIGQLGELGPSITETLGLAAAMQELGLTAEISASGLSNIFLTAGEKSETFAAQLGMTTESFQELFRNDPNEMILRLADSLKDASKDPVEMANAMKKLGLGTQESIKVMSLLATKTDFVKEKQALAALEFEKGTSILDEYNIKNNTTAASIDKLKNKFTVFKDGVGNALMGIADVLLTGNFQAKFFQAFNISEDNPFIQGLFKIREKVMEFIQLISASWPSIQVVFASVWTSISSLITSTVIPVLTQIWSWGYKIWQIVIENWPQIATIVQLVVDIIKGRLDVMIMAFNFLWPIIKFVGGVFISVFQAILPVVLSVIGWILEHFAVLQNWLIERIPFALDFLRNVWKNVLLPLFNAFKLSFDTILLPVLKVIFEWFKNQLAVAINFLKGVWNNVLIPLFHAVKWIWDTILSPVFSAIGNWLASHIPNAIRVLANFWNSTLLPLISRVWDMYKQFFEPTFSSIINWMVGHLPNAINTIVHIWRNVFLPIFGGIHDVWVTILYPTLQAIVGKFGELKGVISSMANMGGAVFGSVISAMRSGINNIIGMINTAINFINNNLIASINNVPGINVSYIPNIPSLDVGINRVPNDMMAMIHKNEAVVPANMNPFNPNAKAPALSGAPMSASKGASYVKSDNEYNFNITIDGAKHTDGQSMAQEIYGTIQGMLAKDNRNTNLGLNSTM